LQLEPFVTNDGETLHHNGSDEKSPNFLVVSFDLILTKDYFIFVLEIPRGGKKQKAEYKKVYQLFQ